MGIVFVSSNVVQLGALTFALVHSVLEEQQTDSTPPQKKLLFNFFVLNLSSLFSLSASSPDRVFSS